VFHQRFSQVADDHSPQRRIWYLFGAAALLITVLVLFRAGNKDESQYVAAIALMRSGWLYRDFAYLQTPLQPLVLSPLALLPAGWVFGALRVLNGLLALGTLAILFAALRLRASSASIMLALGALVCSQPFLLAGSLARNDALPMLLIAAAVAALLRGVSTRSPLAFALAGLLLGLATSAKISAAVPAAGAVLFLLLRCRGSGFRNAMLFAAGALVGLIPCFLLAIAWPSEFRFDVFDYSLSAPAQWWTMVGKAYELQPPHRVLALIGLYGRGSVLLALIAVAIDRKRGDERLLLDLMIIGGVIGSYMPEPAESQYLVPLLPPLFARFALALDEAGHRSRAACFGLAVIGSIAGLGFSAAHLVSRIAIVDATGVGPKVAALAAGGTVASLSPEWVAGTGINLDPRFAAGPFLFRTDGALAGSAEVYGHAISWRNAGELLGFRPPQIVLVGGERKPQPPLHIDGLDAPMAAWAVSQKYRPVSVGSGFVAYVSPVKRS
jgi:hypothetical protein